MMTWLQVHWDHLMEEMAWMGKEFARSAACSLQHVPQLCVYHATPNCCSSTDLPRQLLPASP